MQRLHQQQAATNRRRSSLMCIVSNPTTGWNYASRCVDYLQSWEKYNATS
jgi:hypothetical protein